MGAWELHGNTAWTVGDFLSIPRYKTKAQARLNSMPFLILTKTVHLWEIAHKAESRIYVTVLYFKNPIWNQRNQHIHQNSTVNSRGQLKLTVRQSHIETFQTICLEVVSSIFILLTCNSVCGMQNNSPLRICPNSPKAVNVTLHSKADFADVIKVTDILNNPDGPNGIT